VDPGTFLHLSSCQLGLPDIWGVRLTHQIALQRLSLNDATRELEDFREQANICQILLNQQDFLVEEDMNINRAPLQNSEDQL